MHSRGRARSGEYLSPAGPVLGSTSREPTVDGARNSELTDQRLTAQVLVLPILECPAQRYVRDPAGWQGIRRVSDQPGARAKDRCIRASAAATGWWSAATRPATMPGIAQGS